MKKASKRRKIIATPPMLAVDYTIPEIETEIRAAIMAFEIGYADGHHHATLADRLSIHVFAQAEKKRNPTRSATVAAASRALDQMLARRKAGGPMSADADEIAALTHFVNMDAHFWRRQSGGLMYRCKKKLDDIQSKQAAALREKEAA